MDIMKTGTELITEERKRQIEKEGWTPEHDSQHTDESLAYAGACYALPELTRTASDKKRSPKYFPWAEECWKPTPDDRVRELTKAGALIAAEIDRLQSHLENPIITTGKPTDGKLTVKLQTK